MLVDKIKTSGNELKIKLTKGDGTTTIKVIKEDQPVRKTNKTITRPGTFTKEN